jgi:hypothetical protein
MLRAVFTGLFILAPIIADAAPDPSDPHWIRDTAKDCWAADADPEPGETIVWTGACVDGLISGQGTLSWYQVGRLTGRDEGNFVKGELSGHGRILRGDGTSFEGDFPGKGVLTLPNGERVNAVSVKEAVGWSVEQTR